MLIDARTLNPKTNPKAKVCIIGAGAAGITIARSLSHSGINSILLESGDFSYDDPTQSLYKGESYGLSKGDYLQTSRLRYFGGTTNHWSGNCRPLDPQDMEKCDWIPYSGWPFSREELNPYYQEATKICQLDPLSTYNNRNLGPQNPGLHMNDSNKVDLSLFQAFPTRFGQVYRDELVASSTLTIYSHANVLTIEAKKEGHSISHLEMGTLDGLRFQVTADHYILATGGIENPRLLLLSNSVQKQGLGNEHDLVGRYFGGHPTVLGAAHACLWLPSDDLNFFERKQTLSSGKGTLWGLYHLPDAVRKEHRLRNCGIILKKLHKREKLLNILKSNNSDVCTTGQAIDQLRSGKQLSDISNVRLRLSLEAAPNPDNRVTLLDHDTDKLGKRRARLEWRASDEDIDSMWRSLEIFANEIAKHSLGRVKLNRRKDQYSVHPNYHHLGSTRMHNDPHQGVVDANCKVHSLSNLYIAGSSIFPTYGYANPTLTIVALAIRLANHIQKQLT